MFPFYQFGFGNMQKEVTKKYSHFILPPTGAIRHLLTGPIDVVQYHLHGILFCQVVHRDDELVVARVIA